MLFSDIPFYLGLPLVILVIYMLLPSRPRRPSQLEMKDFSPPKNYSNKQLPGAKTVQAEVITEDDEPTQPGVKSSDWASPTILADGKMKDAYSVLGLSSGTPLPQVHEHMAYLLKQKNSPSKIELFKRAYQAIVDAHRG